MFTEADSIFEAFCGESGLAARRIPETVTKTPDYELDLGETLVAVEVKLIEANAADHAYRAHLTTHGWAHGFVAFERAKNPIHQATKQLRAYAKGRMPGLVVIYDGAGFTSQYTSPDAIRFCLYGLEQVHLHVPTDPSVQPTNLGSSYGGGRVVTESHNTTLSAVGVLRVDPSGGPVSLSVYHNIHAAMPLAPKLLRLANVRQYTLGSTSPGGFPRWLEISAA